MYDYEPNNPVHIPDVILDYCQQYNSVIQLNYNFTDAINGYGGCWIFSVFIYRYAEWCEREKCNYHSILHPDDIESRCQRHRINREYMPIFYWVGADCISLEESFKKWLEDKAHKKGERWIP